MLRFTPETIWNERFAAVQRDLRRIELLAREELDDRRPELRGSLNKGRGVLAGQARRLEAERAGFSPDERWAGLEALRAAAAGAGEVMLELLAGSALGDAGPEGGVWDLGAARRAEAWLNGLCLPLGIKTAPTVITGRGPLLEPAFDGVRLPFLEEDLWGLPLLGMALGLLAAQDDGGGRVGAALAALLPAAAGPLAIVPPSGQDPSDLQRLHLRHLFAEMYATAALGPVYPLAVFVLDLDYAAPQARSHIAARWSEPGGEPLPVLPAAVERAAALLYVLERRGDPPGVSTALEDLWREVSVSAGVDGVGLLAQARATFAGLHAALYDDLARPLAEIALEGQPERGDWGRAEAWRAYFESKSNPFPGPVQGGPAGLTELLGGLWLHRLAHPTQADEVLQAVEAVLAGRLPPVALAGDAQPPAGWVAGARLERARARQARLKTLIDLPQVRAKTPILAMRFYRLLSAVEQGLDGAGRALAAGETPAFWRALAAVEASAGPLHRAALEFFGGLLLQERKLDREPLELAFGRPGPSLTALADGLLFDYVARTGVEWDARAVIGSDPLVEADTEVMRVRFPDWSPWRLTALGHEFGHLVASDLPDFGRWRARAGQAALLALPREARSAAAARIAARLEELFADVFAVYTLGPAFVLETFWFHLSPLRALDERGVHLSHAERAAVLLQVLSALGEAAGTNPYTELAGALQAGWAAALDECGLQPEADGPFLARQGAALAWAGELFELIDRSFRLGARYGPDRWALAQDLAGCLLERTPPSPERLAELAGRHLRPQVRLVDVLNAYWWAWTARAQTAGERDLLANAMYTLGNRFTGS